MQHTSDDEPIKYKVKVKINDKLRIHQRMKENVSEIILEPHARVIIEPEIELSNSTSDKIIYILLMIVNISLQGIYLIQHN
ncbi:MAG: hypothetical protein LN566_04230 [Rickettsia endosymbiont of Stiretrus anchorago]|nr:hypothetical protein [Rickettsia endosymbiont of Stiretrus anchorago]